MVSTTSEKITTENPSTFITAKYKWMRKCSSCGCEITLGNDVWYKQGAGVRCVNCGPHTDNGNGYSELMGKFATALQEHLNLNQGIDEEAVRQIVDNRIAQVSPRPIEVTVGGKVQVTMTERVHVQFDELVDVVNCGEKNIMLVGPAGSGKTTLAKKLATALGKDFGFISLSAGVTETHLFGRILPQADGSWQYVPTKFIEIYENGGIFLLDEVDAADANVMVSINAALANGMFANPVDGKVHHRHPETIIIAAANTYGNGGDAQYVGRNALDAATKDRYVLSKIHVNYDVSMEDAIAKQIIGKDNYAEELIVWVANLRERIANNRIRKVASTRLVISAAKAIAAGKSMTQIKERYFLDWSTDEKNRVGAND
ncbi:MAG: hypothetical protein A2Y12_01280 [Planctomycetes bacterium GWF2_42_9]|nr:MAG: hypothetical protein A2Y12_01280 [Planctomycetes bacterium GWF2_42_9]HAL44808.1 hypothetical protein [Phycisphaerales bacterium]